MTSVATSAPSRATSILVVDDSLIDRHIVGRILEKQDQWSTRYANNGAEALADIEHDPPTLVLTDLCMPDMDGLALVEAVRQKYPQIPVVLMTRNGSEEIAIQALKRGAASYVPKRNLAAALVQTLQQVLVAAQTDGHRRALASLTGRKSWFSLQGDAALVPPLVAILQEELLALRLCDATGTIRVCMALKESLLNAVYHGTLQVKPPTPREEGTDEYLGLLQQRLRRSPYRERRIRLLADVTSSQAAYVVLDEGPGFDPATLPDPEDAANLEQGVGRGLMLIRTFMDRVTYNPLGNQITMIKYRDVK